MDDLLFLCVTMGTIGMFLVESMNPCFNKQPGVIPCSRDKARNVSSVYINTNIRPSTGEQTCTCYVTSLTNTTVRYSGDSLAYDNPDVIDDMSIVFDDNDVASDSTGLVHLQSQQNVAVTFKTRSGYNGTTYCMTLNVPDSHTSDARMSIDCSPLNNDTHQTTPKHNIDHKETTTTPNTQDCDDTSAQSVCTNATITSERPMFINNYDIQKYHANRCHCKLTSFKTTPVEITISIHKTYSIDLVYDQVFTFRTSGTSVNLGAGGQTESTLSMKGGEIEIEYQNFDNDTPVLPLCLKLEASNATLTLDCSPQRLIPLSTIRPAAKNQDTGNNTRNIVIGAVASVFLIVGVVLLIVYMRWRSHQKMKQNEDTADEVIENPMYNPSVMNNHHDQRTQPLDKSEQRHVSCVSSHEYMYISDKEVDHPETEIYAIPNDDIRLIGKSSEYTDAKGSEYVDVYSAAGNLNSDIKAIKSVKSSDVNDLNDSSTYAGIFSSMSSGMLASNDVYDHTTDKQKLLPVNEYNRLGVVTRATEADPLNEYDHTSKHV